MGLGYSDLSEVNPDLIYLSIRGFSGKMADRPGHDINFIGNSGVGDWFLENGTPNQSTQFADMVGGTLVPAIRLLMHLCNPARRGMHLVCYMDEGFRTLYLARAFETSQGAKTPEAKRVHEQMSGELPHSRFYRCRDDHWVSLNAIQKKHWDSFCDVVDQPKWVDRWDDPSLVPELEKMFLDAPSNYWEALTNKKDTCLFKVVPWEEHLNYSQANAQLGSDPLTWCGFAPNLALGPVPELGGDTFAILSAMGFSNKDLAEWAANSVLKMQAPPES
jgi:crotonobetainyl-CoA:carnitine CoA-transferase CaiB-like acyl-CoA transferase